MPTPARNQAPDDRHRMLSPGTWAVGAASFFSDSGHEMVTSVLPSFVTTVLGGSAAILGLIEGLSDALTGVAKMASGPRADDPERRRKLATGGYLVTAGATAAIGLTVAPWQAGILRAFAWAARGVRTPARDALLGSLAHEGGYGRAYGVERAGDNLGALVGPLLASVLVGWVGIRPTMWLSVIPGLLAALAITIAAKEAKGLYGAAAHHVRSKMTALRGTGIARAMAPIALFECGNLATTLLILRATNALGAIGVAAAATVAILMYAGHNLVAAVVAPLAGAWIDRSSARIVFGTGAASYLIAYGLLGLAPWGAAGIAIGFALAGAGIGLAETAESTLVAQLLPDRLRGSGFGVLGGVQSGGDIIATVIAGVLYTTVSPEAAFVYAAAWMLLATLACVLVRPAARS